MQISANTIDSIYEAHKRGGSSYREKLEDELIYEQPYIHEAMVVNCCQLEHALEKAGVPSNVINCVMENFTFLSSAIVKSFKVQEECESLEKIFA